jgi:hypothetical protein
MDLYWVFSPPPKKNAPDNEILTEYSLFGLGIFGTSCLHIHGISGKIMMVVKDWMNTTICTGVSP